MCDSGWMDFELGGESAIVMSESRIITNNCSMRFMKALLLFDSSFHTACG